LLQDRVDDGHAGIVGDAKAPSASLSRVMDRRDPAAHHDVHAST
jgi:hypothetical protein